MAKARIGIRASEDLWRLIDRIVEVFKNYFHVENLNGVVFIQKTMIKGLQFYINYAFKLNSYCGNETVRGELVSIQEDFNNYIKNSLYGTASKVSKVKTVTLEKEFFGYIEDILKAENCILGQDIAINNILKGMIIYGIDHYISVLERMLPESAAMCNMDDIKKYVASLDTNL